MENQTKNSKKSIMLNFGLLLGFASIIVALGNYMFGDLYDPHWSMMVFGLTVSIVITFLGIKKVKEVNDGFLTVGEAIKAGLGISLISALIYIVYLMIFYNFIEPEFFVNLTEFSEQKMLENNPNMSDEALEGAKKGIAMFANTGANVTITLIFSLFIGLIISLISGLILKNTKED